MVQHASAIATFILSVLGVVMTLNKPWAERYKTYIIWSFIAIGAIGVLANIKVSMDSESANTALNTSLTSAIKELKSSNDKRIKIERNNSDLQKQNLALQKELSEEAAREKKTQAELQAKKERADKHMQKRFFDPLRNLIKRGEGELNILITEPPAGSRWKILQAYGLKMATRCRLILGCPLLRPDGCCAVFRATARRFAEI